MLNRQVRSWMSGDRYRKLQAIDVIHALSDPFMLRGVPADIRSDDGSEFVAKVA
jgi:hypothetical protein